MLTLRRWSANWFRLKRSEPKPVRRKRATLALERLEDRLVPAAGIDTTPAVTFAVVNNWGSGYQAGVTLLNDQSATIHDWRLEFNLATNIDSIWNAQIVSHVGDRYIVKADGSNGNLDAGKSASFGFTAGGTTSPSSYVLTWGAEPAATSTVAVDFAVTSDWKTGFGGSISIKNTGTASISGWKLEFDFGHAIDSIWNARIDSRQGNHYVIRDGGHNAVIAPGATVSFGFNGSPGNVTTKPTGHIFNGQPVGGVTPPPPPATPSITVADVSVTEGNAGTTTATFTLTLSQAATQAVSVAYATADQTALAGSDYQAISGTVTFAAGQTQRTVSVLVNGDTTVEPNETFLFKLSNPVGATLARVQALGTIMNDDVAVALPTISIGNASVTEGNSGTTLATFTVSLSKAASGTVSVAYTTADGTASAGSDYVAASGTLTFAAGETQKTVAIQVKGDTLQESNETFFVNLSAAVGATIAVAAGQGTIINDDAPTTSTFNYGEALQKALFFYEANRSGDLPDDYIVDWRGDSAMSDGSDVGVDLTGGYYDAGDHVKFGLPMSGSMTLLAWGVDQYRDAYQQSGQLDRVLEAIKWGTDWIVKAHTAPNEFWGQVGRGDLDHAAWVPPEVMQMARPAYKIDATRPGSDLAGEAAAALAAASLVFRATDTAYADKLLQHAIQLYSFADTYRGKYSDSITDAASYYNSFSGYQDELVWGAIWLYKATGNAAYLNKAETYYAQHFAGQTMTWTHSWDDKRYGAAVMLAQATGKQVYRSDAERWLDYWSVGINGGATRITYTPGGLAFLSNWGSLRYASTTAFIALIYADTVKDYNGRYHDFALGQMEYILGKNPNNRSYVVGFGNNPPQNPHHRGGSGIWDGNVSNAAPNRHVLYGALVGGPESANDNDYHDVRSNYISNEVALDYNAGFTGALARLFLEYGGQPLADFPKPDVRDREFFVQASVNQQGSTFTEVRAVLNNRSAWPARLSSDLSFRYFVNLSEVYAAGYTVSDVVVQSSYSQGAKLSVLLPWDAAQRIYYVDVSFAGVVIGPGAGMFAKESQLRIGLRNGLPASAWNPANDWSFQGLSLNRDLLAPSDFIPVYEFGTQHLSGLTPTSTPGVPIISINDVTVTEGNTGTKTAVFTVQLSGPATSPVTVSYATANGSATAGSDYLAASGTLAFAPGTTTQTIAVTILGDTLVEGKETFFVNLSGATNAVIGIAQATGSIADDDAPATGIGVAFKVRDNWSTGFVADMTIRNLGAAAINGWTIAFDFDGAITSIWNAVIVSHVGKRYVIRAADWNKTIAAGGEVTFGFQGTPGTVPTPTGILVNEKEVEVL
ncbi:MAG: hypothetical protein FJ271_14115 [Planctomycetes bacterium]|nr:hypothetical protein [Planctomycetota bacterium]